eukprot:NODE_2329_length_1146_cov_10.887876_g1935_i0.p1 GENE.NODE_2329_length_1146_cov_10.887876_g1935_i0~~NODE_2329_length_1146_cov_10.887876_g1935_i0.p1  ORF type:complete len:305 (-),score=64.91 NODE_2329_length_1146_cov_10.887876_g1935_i0:88-1002(-)
MAASSSSSSAPLFRDQTRATKFQQKYQFPAEFPQVLKDFTREVLRHQPRDIPSFGCDYFTKLALEKTGGPSADINLDKHTTEKKSTLPDSMSEAILTEFQMLFAQVSELLGAQDSHKTGVLSWEQLRNALTSSDGLDLPVEHVLYLLSAYPAAANFETMTISYTALLSRSIPALHYFCTVGHEFVPDPKEVDHIHGHSKATIQHELLALLQAQDPSSSGLVSFQTYRNILRTAPISLTERDVALLSFETIVNKDDLVDYRTEVETRVYPLLGLAESFEAFEQNANNGSIALPVPLGTVLPALES